MRSKLIFYYLRHITKVTMFCVFGLQMLNLPYAVAQKAPAASKQKKTASSSGTANGKTSRPGAHAPAAAKDEVIVQIMHDVSPQQIQKNIEKLVSFGTRNTLSVNNPDAATSGKGIVAAREWIKSEFERYSDACGGCLEVKMDE